MIYPERILYKRIHKQMIPGIIVIDDEIYTSRVIKRIFKFSAFESLNKLFCTLFFIITLATVAIFYIAPYTELRFSTNITEQRMEGTKILFADSSLINNLNNININEFSQTNYADETVMISLEVTDDNLAKVLSAVEKSNGVTGLQYSLGKLHITILRGGL